MSPTKRARGLAPFPHFPEKIRAREDSRLCPGVMPFLFVSSGELSRDLPCAARLWRTRDSSPGCKTLDGHRHLAQCEHHQEARQSGERQDKGEGGVRERSSLCKIISLEFQYLRWSPPSVEACPSPGFPRVDNLTQGVPEVCHSTPR